MPQPQVGLQLIIYGDRPRHDLPRVLKEAAQAGYAGIEDGAPTEPSELEKWRGALNEAGLACAGGHSGLDQLGDLDRVRKMARGIRDLGGRFLMASGRYEDLEGYRKGARILTEAGRACREAGVTLCYHNHYWEFQPIDGTRPIDILISEADPAVAKLCPDVYWVHVGGEDPARFIAAHRDRCPYFHFKDGMAGERFSEFRELGQGVVDLKAALEAALSCNPEWVTVEQDTTQRTPAESIRMSRDYLRSLGL